MINEEKRGVQIYVINSNTGQVDRSECIVTNESLITVVERYATKDSIVVTLMPDVLYCFYINREVYMCTNNKTSIELINFLKMCYVVYMITLEAVSTLNTVELQPYVNMLML